MYALLNERNITSELMQEISSKEKMNSPSSTTSTMENKVLMEIMTTHVAHDCLQLNIIHVLC